MKVLLLAFDCHPTLPSLPVVGYKMCKALSEITEFTVVTRNDNSHIDYGDLPVEFVNVTLVKRFFDWIGNIIRRDQEIGWTIKTAFTYPSYIAFEFAVWRKYKKAIKKGKYDIIHRITPMSPTLPSPLAIWSPIPFVAGPLNGGLAWPHIFETQRKQEREWSSYLRKMYKLLPYYQSSYKACAAILASFEHTRKELPEVDFTKVFSFPEVGFDPSLFMKRKNSPGQKNQVTFLFVGRFVPSKLPEIILKAFSKSALLKQHKIKIVGSGPKKSEMDRIIKENNLQQCVEFINFCPQYEVVQHMHQSDVFVFPSIRELGAGVVVEAMACGLASIVINYGAPGDLIGKERGITIPIGSYEDILMRLIKSMEKLINERSLIQKFGDNASHYAWENYTWEAKANHTLLIYNWILNPDKSPPSCY